MAGTGLRGDQAKRTPGRLPHKANEESEENGPADDQEDSEDQEDQDQEDEDQEKEQEEQEEQDWEGIEEGSHETWKRARNMTDAEEEEPSEKRQKTSGSSSSYVKNGGENRSTFDVAEIIRKGKGDVEYRRAFRRVYRALPDEGVLLPGMLERLEFNKEADRFFAWLSGVFERRLLEKPDRSVYENMTKAYEAYRAWFIALRK